MAKEYQEAFPVIISKINGGRKIFYEKKYARIGVNNDVDVRPNKPLEFPTLNLSTHLFRWMFVWAIKMLKYDRIDISEWIDVNKTNKTKACKICY